MFPPYDKSNCKFGKKRYNFGMELSLPFGLGFSDLHLREGLIALDGIFCDQLAAQDTALYTRLLAARGQGISGLDESNLILDLAPYVEDFIASLFSIKPQVDLLRVKHGILSPMYACKRNFVQRQAVKKISVADAEKLDGADLRRQLEAFMGSKFSCLLFAERIMQWLVEPVCHKQELDLAERYAAWAVLSEAGKKFHKHDTLFRLPKKTDPQNLLDLDIELRDGYRVLRAKKDDLHPRRGFALTDKGCDLEFALDQANYCIWCHKQGKDSCSKGLRDKGTEAFQKSAHGVELAGCPLDEKISEMNLLKAQGILIGALATAIVDNPMLAATGHRICNDCMKSCIFQKQEPVDIPQIETRTLRDVLSLPWGFEIYSLLTRWNPLNFVRPLPRAETGRKVLIVGAGPAGFTLAHHLMNDGHYVCMIDGLKIEPLQIPFAPIRDAKELWEDLDKRIMAGFGGVAEYGITVRWDKNFLKIIRLLLERRSGFDLYGGTRFGGTITADQAFSLGFDHVALCMGAGKPTILDVPGNLTKGVRAASDFLMALQLTGAAKVDSLANLQLRLPVVVIGGGLTALDTATEALAYYPLQVEKFLSRMEQNPTTAWDGQDKEIADEFIRHAKALRAARQSGEAMAEWSLLREWGGVTIAYRRDFIESPGYSLNHEEVGKAMQEGIFFADHLTPQKINCGDSGWVQSVDMIGRDGVSINLAAKSVLVAAGTQPNTVLAREGQTGIVMDGKFFAALDEQGNILRPQRSAKPDQAHIFAHHRADGHKISFLGDLHPSFSGNVVKAMASAKRGYPLITQCLQSLPASAVDTQSLKEKMRLGLNATVSDVVRLTPQIIEIVVHAPFAASAFQPGQFFRLQNFESLVGHKNGTSLAIEGLAMTGAWVDKDKGLISTIVLEMGGSSSLVAGLKIGDPVVLMGPTGQATELSQNETVLLVGGGLGNAVLFSIGQALKARQNKVIYFAGYKTAGSRFKPEQIEAASDIVVWCCEESPGFVPQRKDDRSYVGNVVAAMLQHKDLLADASRLICIGSDRMMAAVAQARHKELKPHLRADHFAIGSINSPMQCMMKEICAQCIQRHIDPITGKEEIVFSCFNQDQELDKVDWKCLNDRLRQNSVQEKLTARWIENLISE